MDWSLFPLPNLIKFSQSTYRNSRITFSQSNLYQSLSKIFDLAEDGFEKISGAIRNCGRWSDLAAVRFPNIELRVITFEKMFLWFWSYFLFWFLV